MQYISAEEFLKQPQEARRVLKEWWKENMQLYDLYKTTRKYSEVFCIQNKQHLDNTKDFIDAIIPLLTEGQLRKFIEDKTEGTIDLYYTHMEDKHYKTINKAKYLELSDLREIIFRMRFESDEDIFKAYWKCALKIARGEFRE